jgi:hypothetical protein
MKYREELVTILNKYGLQPVCETQYCEQCDGEHEVYIGYKLDEALPLESSHNLHKDLKKINYYETGESYQRMMSPRDNGKCIEWIDEFDLLYDKSLAEIIDIIIID